MDPHPSRSGSPEAPAGKAVEADMTDYNAAIASDAALANNCLRFTSRLRCVFARS